MVKLSFSSDGEFVASTDVFTSNLNITLCPASGLAIRYGIHYESLAGVLGGSLVLRALMEDAGLVLSGGVA